MTEAGVDILNQYGSFFKYGNPRNCRSQNTMMLTIGTPKNVTVNVGKP